MKQGPDTNTFSEDIASQNPLIDHHDNFRSYVSRTLPPSFGVDQVDPWNMSQWPPGTGVINEALSLAVSK